ncbi:hypothetical protein J6590_008971 [Homalodisca vitripennis]|nr:hypothetical protein J6590_008971 [Homalodisca vitripennis]
MALKMPPKRALLATVTSDLRSHPDLLTFLISDHNYFKTVIKDQLMNSIGSEGAIPNFLPHLGWSLEGFERKNSKAVVLTDLSKAFNCVSHSILLCKLRNYVCTHWVIELLQSYRPHAGFVKKWCHLFTSARYA